MFKRQFSVRRFKKGGFHVVVMVLPGSDEMWVERQHPAVFVSQAAAEHLMARMQVSAIDLSKWIGQDWAGSPLRVDESQNPAFYSPLKQPR